MARRASQLTIEIFPSAKFLGGLLKAHRESAGLSLRQLAIRSGVTTSEIWKLESTDQNCRLDSLLRICSALGVPIGSVVDGVLCVNAFFYEPGILRSAKAASIIKTEEFAYDEAVFLLCALAGFAAQLVISCKPAAVAEEIEYPNEGMRAAFLSFAQSLESGMSAAARIEFLTRLKLEPIETLTEVHLFSENLFLGFYRHTQTEFLKTDLLKRPSGSRVRLAETTWAAVLPLRAKKEPGNILTKAETSDLLSEVKTQMPGLLARLKKAAAETGKKSELAKFLSKATGQEVPLASVSRWLSGEREPGGEVALLLDLWATDHGYPRAKQSR